MGDQFFTDFLSKKNINELRQILTKEKPSFEELLQLIARLEKSQAFEHIRLLAILVQEQIIDLNPQRNLLDSINQIILAHAFQTNNTLEIKNQLEALKQSSNNNDIAWYKALEGLLQWIEQSPSSEEIKSVLAHLPPVICEKLYQRLLETATGEKSWVSPLIQFVLSAKPLENDTHLETLARSLILSPIHCNTEQLKSLSLLLSTPQLIDVTFHLRAIASTYTSNKTPTNSSKLKTIYLNHYEELLRCLTIRATATESEYQELTGNNAELANLLMYTRLKLLDSVEEQRQLIFNLLKNCQQFNWRDSQFHTFILEQIVHVFEGLPTEQITRYFRDYYDYHYNQNFYDVTRLLDALFEKIQDFTVILACLKQCNDEDNFLIINYLTSSKLRNNALLRGCLMMMDIGQLLSFFGPLTALGHLYRHEQPHYLTTCCSVIIGKIQETKTASEHFAKLVLAIPDQALDDMVELVFKELKSPQLQYEWLMALLNSRISKTKLLPYCRALLNQGIDVPLKLSILKKFLCEEFFHFYLYMVRNQAREEEFACFVEFFKETDRQPILLYILSNTPLISQAFLSKLLDSIEIKNIIYLIESLVDLAKSNAEYNTTLEQLLLYFCGKLQTTYDSKNPVHHWILCENKALIALQLLLSPACFASLSSRSSTVQYYTPSVLQNIICYDTSTDLKLRITSVLNTARLDEPLAATIALNWLSHFRQEPATLQHLFTNLSLIEENLTEDGKRNYRLIKASCWSLLKTKEEETLDYEEARVKTLLGSQLSAPSRFDGVLTTLANNLDSNQDVHLNALYLTQIEPKNFAKIKPAVIASVLLHSLEDKTQENWKRTAQYLQTQEPENTTDFLQLLVEELKKVKNNPWLINQVFQFICQLPQFDKLLPLLNDEILQWLVKESNEEFLKSNFCKWLEKLNERGRLPDIALGPLLALLPADPQLLNAVLQQKILSPYLPLLFVEFTRHAHCDIHCISLYQQINKLNATDKRKAIDYAQRHLGKAGHRLSFAAPVLTMLILDLADIQFHNFNDRALILQQLKLFNQWAKDNKDKNTDFIKELENQLFNIINFLNERDNQWTKLILGEQAFAHLVLSCLDHVDVKIIDRHPFTTVLLNHITFPLHPDLTQAPRFQNFIKQLLLNPPAVIKEDQFTLLFDKLDTKEGRQLALDLLKRPALEDVHWSALLTLSCALSVKELFTIYEKSKTRFVFVDLIVRHQEGIHSLNSQQKKSLLANLDSGKQLLRILDSQTAIKSKFDFVSALFEHLEATDTSLEVWLHRINVDGQTLAALANYTTQEKHQQLVRKLIETNTYRQYEIKQYLQHPTLDMPLNQEGVLYDFVRNIWLHPERGNPCHPMLLKNLDLKTLKSTLHNHYRFLSHLEDYPSFFAPFSTSEHVAGETLAAARWLHRLPLLNDGLLEIINHFKECQDEKMKTAIQNTSLYKKLIQPLLDNMSFNTLFEVQLNELHTLLKDYINALPAENQHRKWVQITLSQYDFSLQSMGCSVTTMIHSLFLPGCHSGKIQKGGTIKLHPEIVGHLLVIEPKALPDIRMPTLLAESVRNPLLLQDQGMQTWLLDKFLFSSLAINAIDTSLLNTLVSGFIPKEFATKMHAIKKKLIGYEDSFRFLKELKKHTNLLDIVLLLKGEKNLVEMLEACELANLPHLSQLIILVLHSNRLGLKPEQIQALLPLPSIASQTVEWLQHDLTRMDSRKSQLVEQHHVIEREGLKYRADNKNVARLNELAHASIHATSPLHFYIALNSYVAVFEKNYDEESKVAFIKLLSYLLIQEKNSAEFLSHLNAKLLELIIDYILNNPNLPDFLLEKLALHGYAQKCQQLAKTKLQQILQGILQTNPSPERLEELSLEQWGKIPLPHLEPLLRIQRLLFLIEPEAELLDWRNKSSEIKPHARAYFSADASLFKLLTKQEQEAQQLYTSKQLSTETEGNLKAAFNFFKTKNKSADYFSMENFPQKNQFHEPAVARHYYGLYAFLSENPEGLIDGFIEWLTAQEPTTLNKQGQLKELLLTICNKQLLKEFSQRLANNSLNNAQITWIYSQLKSFNVSQEQLIEVATTAFNWDWLQNEIRTTKMPESLSLLQAAVANKKGEVAILANNQSQQAFLKMLATCKFPANELINLLKNSSRALRSLLALHLLGRMDYLEKLSGQSLLTQLSPLPPTLLPRRLQSLTQLIDASLLTPERLDNLSDEAIVNLFCSPLHFHYFDQRQLALLFKRLGSQARDNFIRYWLNHCAHLPNSADFLIALTQAFTKQVQTCIQEMDAVIRRPLLMTLIEKHRLLSESSQLNGIITSCDETHLTHALQLYLHGRKDWQSLIDLIKNLLAAVDLQKCSSITLQLLIRVTEDNHFSDLQARLSPATSDYIRQNALRGNCAVFYDDGILSIQRLRKPLIDQNKEKSQSSHGIFSFLFTATNTNEPEPLLNSEPGVFEELKKEFTTVHSFHYFLIHYQGNDESLKRLIKDYLEYCSHEQQVQHLHAAAWLINQTSISPATRKILFESLWKTPTVMDAQIASCLLKYDAIQVVKGLGLQKKYQELSTLCKQTLPLLDYYSDTATIVRTAGAEADFEVALSQTSSFLREWRIWFRRCFFYGWSGWFVPKKPQFVTSFEEEPARLGLIFPDMTNHQKFSSTREKSLDELLDYMQSNTSMANWDALEKALEIYDWQEQKPDELVTRERIDQFFSELLQRAKELTFSSWLAQHKAIFVKNRTILVGLYSQKGDEEALRKLLQKAPVDYQFKHIADELLTTKEPSSIENSTVVTSDKKLEDTNIVTQFITTTASAVGALPRLLFWGQGNPSQTTTGGSLSKINSATVL